MSGACRADQRERPARPRSNVKTIRGPPGATRRVSSRVMGKAPHPEHGEAGLLIVFTPTTIDIILAFLGWFLFKTNQGLAIAEIPFFLNIPLFLRLFVSRVLHSVALFG